MPLPPTAANTWPNGCCGRWRPAFRPAGRPVHSAALLAVDQQPFALVDLRCDGDDDGPVAFLRRLWSDYAPQMEAYRIRAFDPTKAPSYGVAGDP